MMIAFLRHYRDHLKVEKGRIKNLGDMFDTEGFVAKAIKSTNPYWQKLCQRKRSVLLCKRGLFNKIILLCLF